MYRDWIMGSCRLSHRITSQWCNRGSFYLAAMNFILLKQNRLALALSVLTVVRIWMFVAIDSSLRSTLSEV